MRPHYFCYVYDLPEGTPLMYPLEADTLTDAVSETRRVMADDVSHSRFAEIWDGEAGSPVTRIEGLVPEAIPPGLLRSLRRGRIS